MVVLIRARRQKAASRLYSADKYDQKRPNVWYYALTWDMHALRSLLKTVKIEGHTSSTS
ncbi:hypothetical protein [Caballeronia sp. CLC5]|uniref:hypothetical protein n=1 Tax=Caballeronia sp. CLC5 TaxID=2906764 RepID=UPI001F1E07BA|nr:hypothetical protein [Caballeronia sp. CLC5]MCE4574264.1 hypothetical protein [Caballeronia sp. CLC5]